jgi:N-acetyl sugar amidotransferase
MMTKICTRCILDSSFPQISFDTQGVCNYCNSYDITDKRYALTEETEKKLHAVINVIKKEGTGKEYDCMLGVSGGRDSTYCLYLLKKWGLRPLAVHFDNNMDSKIAAENIKNACTILDVDLHTFVIDWDEYKDLQVAFLKASIPAVDVPMDQAFVSVLFQYAWENKIKFLFSGYTIRGEGPIPKQWTCLDIPFLLDIHKKFGKIPLNKYPIRTPFDLIKYRLSGITRINPLNYIDFRYDIIMPVLEKELRWKYYGGHHFESIFTRWAFAYYLPKKFGIDKRVTDYSVLIRSGQITREEAMKKMKESIYSSDQEQEDRRYIMNKLDLTDLDMEEIFNALPKKNSDYAHHSRYFRILNQLLWPRQF